jgi:type II secretory pathway component PulF
MIEYYTPTQKLPSTAPHAVLRVLLRIGLWILALIIIAMVLGTCVLADELPLWFYPIAFPLVLTAILLLVIMSYVMRRVRRRRVLSIMSYVDQAIRLNMPLIPWLDAAARSEGRGLARRLEQLSMMLSHAVPIARAVDAAVPEASDRQVAVMAAAEQTGALSPALRSLVQEDRDLAPGDIAQAGFRVTYVTLVCVMILLATSFVLIFVMPKFEQIFLDFGIRLPPVTLALLEVGRHAGLPLVVLAIAWFVVVTARALERTFIGWRTRSIWRPLTDRLAWYLPIIRTSTRSRQYGDFCAAMASAMEGALPMQRAVHDASLVATNAVFRETVRAWAIAMETGVAPAEAARQAGLPHVMIGLLATSTDGDSATTVFRFLARYYHGRFSRAQALLQAAVVPAMVLCFAAIVAFIVLGLFLPMINLIDSVALSTGF